MRIKTGQVTMKLFMALFLLGIPSVAPVVYSLKHFYAAYPQVPNLPLFVVNTFVDEVQIMHYDSNKRKAVPNQDWMDTITEHDPTFWEDETERLRGNEQILKGLMETLKQPLNLTGGFFFFQGIFGCEWDNETDELKRFNQFGYDGEDFISLDLKTEKWIPLNQQAVIAKQMLDNEKALLAYFRFYFNNRCLGLLKTFVNAGKSSLMRKELPSVSLLQKTPSSPVTCHATGFYPDRADLFWQRDEEELHEAVDRGEILPNHDGTFQMSVDLDLSSVKAEDWGRYSCVFHLAGVKDGVLRPLDKRQIRTNWRGFPTAAVVVVVGLLLLAGCIIGIVLWRRNSHGCKCTNTSETSSSSGEDSAVKKRTSEEQTMLETR